MFCGCTFGVVFTVIDYLAHMGRYLFYGCRASTSRQGGLDDQYSVYRLERVVLVVSGSAKIR
jgi:hypothetical protein